MNLKFLMAVVACCGAMALAQAQTVAVQPYNLQVTPAMGSISNITGQLRNETNTSWGKVFLKINLYDESNALVGNTITMASDLPAGGVWSFKAQATVNFYRFEVVSVEVF